MCKTGRQDRYTELNKEEAVYDTELSRSQVSKS